jgi:DNA-binding LytR/AlgR family response regulator
VQKNDCLEDERNMVEKELRILICDDEAEGRQALTHGVETAFPDGAYTLEVFAHAEEVREALGRFLPEIAILDIQLEQESGIRLAEKILERCPRCRILFVSGYLEYAPDVYDVEHVCFILKTQLEQRLPVFLARACARIQAERSRVLQVRVNTEERIIRQADILYLESVKREVRIVTKDETLAVYGKLDELGQKLNSVCFLRCHKSFLVNLDYAAAFSRRAIRLTNDTEIPISRSCRDAVQAGYLRYLQAKESIL